jgi:hypothetical protein
VEVLNNKRSLMLAVNSVCNAEPNQPSVLPYSLTTFNLQLRSDINLLAASLHNIL